MQPVSDLHCRPGREAPAPHLVQRQPLGAVNDVSRVNMRRYVDGTRHYTYRLEGSVDGTHWFRLGGRGGPAPATDAGDTTNTEAQARYLRIVGLGNTANGTFHLTEVSVSGTPV